MKGRYCVLIDTGAQTCLVSKRILKELDERGNDLGKEKVMAFQMVILKVSLGPELARASFCCV